MLLLALAVPMVRANAAPAAQPGQSAASKPTVPGIFAIGFTNVTDTSARLVFTTSEPMTTAVEIFDKSALVRHLAQPSFDEIHAVPIDHLARMKDYRVVISGQGRATGAVASAETNLAPRLRPPSAHRWPGYTIFSSTINGNGDDVRAMDLMAATGVHMARIEPSWDGIFPRGREVNPVALDRLVHRVAEMKKRGIEPLVILDYCVRWAKPYTDTTMTWRNANFGPPDSLSDWELYVRTVVTALNGYARYYEVWNEPDAGYLATGSFVERPNLPAPIGRPPFKDNRDYWIGDRYMPMVAAVRKVMDELQPGAIVMNGGWNRDYHGERGDLLLERGVGPYMDVYAYHVYTHSPASFSRWHKEIDGGFRQNIDRIFAKNHVQMPLAVTEWGWLAGPSAPEGKGFVAFQDSQLFYLKSTFYFLSMERFEVLSQFCMGIGSAGRDRDPLFFMLVNEDSDHKLVVTPTYKTFQWLALTFGSKGYGALPVQIPGAPQVKAYAIRMKDTGEIYLAAWQDGPVDDGGAITPLPARTVTASIGDIAAGQYRLTVLDRDGQATSRFQTRLKGKASLNLEVRLPEATATAESGVFLERITAGK